ncbi:hypothetical protein KBD08_00135 [Candidatus Babeliales bacterium]|nr:hypothetical protein [Candidatus Babeliales bacterium]
MNYPYLSWLDLSWSRIKTVVSQYIVNFFELQFIITLMSLPILICWGIPISIMAPIANFIFTPLLILFLWCSCFATIIALMGYCDSIFDTMLHGITHIWLSILSYGHPSWLIGFPTSMLPLSILIFLSIIMLYTYIRPSQKISVLILTLMWLAVIGIHPYYCPAQGLHQVGSLPLWLLKLGKRSYLIDHGALCNRKNMYTNLDYTVLPELIKATGHTTAHALIFMKPSTKIAKVALQASKQLNCCTILVTPKAQSYDKVKVACKNTNVSVIPLLSKSAALKKRTTL